MRTQPDQNAAMNRYFRHSGRRAGRNRMTLVLEEAFPASKPQGAHYTSRNQRHFEDMRKTVRTL